MKKIIFIILIVFLFYFSYSFKSFQLLMISISFLSLFGFFLKKINKNLILIIFSILISVTSVEIILLFMNNGKIVKIDSKKNFSKNIKYEKTFLGHQPVPGVQNHMVVINGKIKINKNYTIGDDKFRWTPELDATEKNKTMNFFGGSFTFGWGLNDDETLPYTTQFYFKNWKIKNYGVSGYGIHQMLALIQKNPETIGDLNFLITDTRHIPRATCKRDYSFGTPKYTLNIENKLIRSGYCNYGVFNKIPLPRIIGSVVNRSQIKILIDKLYFRKIDIGKKDVELYLAIISEINKIILGEKKKIIIGYMNANGKINEYVLKKLTQKKIKFVDLSLNPENKEYWLPDEHTSKKGNEKRSLMIANFLKKKQNN